MQQNQPFDKAGFINRLEFFIYCWKYSAGKAEPIIGEEKTKVLSDLAWSEAVMLLWGKRFTNLFIHGVDDIESFNTFCQLISMGINQLTEAFERVRSSDLDAISKVLEIDIMIKSRIQEMADECEELIMTYNF